MQLKELLNIHGKLSWRDQPFDGLALSLTSDSRKVEPGSVYIAVRGHEADGHRYISDAINKGAVGLVVEDIAEIPDFFKGVSVEVLDSRLALQVLSQRFYESPGEQMKAIAVTGTNGKTSFSYVLEYLLNSIDCPTGVIGTIDHHLKDKVWATELTTPDPVTLQSRLKDFLSLGADAFVIEASSHALKQNRINQGFDICVFTNLSRDHMDYHHTEEDYFLSKAKLFSGEMVKGAGFAVINGDDTLGERLSVLAKDREVFLYGEGEHCDFRFKIKGESINQSTFQCYFPNGRSCEIQSPMLGRHNVYNLMAAVSCIYLLNMDYRRAIALFKDFGGIPGRLQQYKSKNDVSCFVDFAHTDDALRKVLQHLQSLLPNKNSRILTVFGCGGDRDKTKRKFMGQIAKDLSDLVFVTSDNPRTEDPQKIIDDICEDIDVEGEAVFVEVDRAKAIEKACSTALPGDIVLVAGKGHEDYQIIGKVKNKFSDYEHIKKAFEG